MYVIWPHDHKTFDSNFGIHTPESFNQNAVFYSMWLSDWMFFKYEYKTGLLESSFTASLDSWRLYSSLLLICLLIWVIIIEMKPMLDLADEQYFHHLPVKHMIYIYGYRCSWLEVQWKNIYLFLNLPHALEQIYPMPLNIFTNDEHQIDIFHQEEKFGPIKIVLIHPLFIEVSVPSQGSGR
jgi:hypothetical protein